MPKRLVSEPGSVAAALEAVARYFAPNRDSVHTTDYNPGNIPASAFALIATARVDYSCVMAATGGTLYAADTVFEWHRTRVGDVRTLADFSPELPTRILFDVEQVRGIWRCGDGAVTRVLAGYLAMPNVTEAHLLVPRTALPALAPVLGQVTAHDAGAGLILLRKHLPGLGYVITRLPSRRARRKMCHEVAAAKPAPIVEDECYDPLEPAIDLYRHSNPSQPPLQPHGMHTGPDPLPQTNASPPPAMLDTNSRIIAQGHAVAVACVAQAHAPLRAAHTYYDDALVAVGKRSIRMPELRTASRAACHYAGLHLLGRIHGPIADALLRQAAELMPALTSRDLPLRAVDVLEHLLTVLAVVEESKYTTWLVERRAHPPHYTVTIVFPSAALSLLQRLVPGTPAPPSPAEADSSFPAAAAQMAASAVLCGLGGLETITRAVVAVRKAQMELAPLQQAALSMLPPLLEDSLGMIFRRCPYTKDVWELYDTTPYGWELVFVARAVNECEFLDMFIRH